MTPEARYKFEFIATLVHESMINPLADWLRDAPPWTEAFTAELISDGFVAVSITKPRAHEEDL